MVRLGEHLSQAEIATATEVLAVYLYLDAGTPAGEILDQYRQGTSDAGRDPIEGPLLRTIGFHELSFPKHGIANLLVPVLCRRLIERWLEGLADYDDQQVRSETEAHASEIGLEAEAVVDRLDGAVRSHWGEDPEKLIQRHLTDWLHDATQGAKQPPKEELAKQVLGRIEKLLGDKPGAWRAPWRSPFRCDCAAKLKL